MGIFNALTTAVTGLQAQAYALQNISGNIANSSTTAFKRTDTSFEDLIGDASSRAQTSGNVTASARATNNVQGDVQTAAISTFMAINGNGYFTVEKPASFVDGRPVFGGVNMYTRRGDFQPDKDGYLVNGAGYYLMGIPVDSTTGNLAGSVPQLLKFQNDFQPAKATTEIDYRANLASYPLTTNHDTNVVGSELLNPADLTSNPIVGAPPMAILAGRAASLVNDAKAVITGSQNVSGFDSGAAATTISINGTAINIPAHSDENAIVAAINGALSPATLTASISGNKLVLTGADADTNLIIDNTTSGSLLSGIGLSLGATNGTNLLTQNAVLQNDTLVVTIGGTTKTIKFGVNAGEVSTLAELNGVNGLGMLAPDATGTVDSNGNIVITATNNSDVITVSGTANLAKFGLHTTSAAPATTYITGNDESTFLRESIGGGAVTAYDLSGSAVNVQLRWAKVASTTTGGADTWNLFYQKNSNATGVQPAWQNAGVNYTFDANGQLTPPVPSLTLIGVVVDGKTLGDIQLVHGAGGITQFADSNGSVKVNQLEQNGFAAGQLQSIAVSDKGHVIGTYSNGRTLDLAAITLADFANPNGLQRADGGAFLATDASGVATFGANGTISGSALEGSNTDIADEFSKLIVTQQAYSANTKIITTGNQMIQDLLNMIR